MTNEILSDASDKIQRILWFIFSEVGECFEGGNPEFVEKGDMFLTRKKYFETIRYAMTRGIFRGIFSYA